MLNRQGSPAGFNATLQLVCLNMGFKTVSSISRSAALHSTMHCLHDFPSRCRQPHSGPARQAAVRAFRRGGLRRAVVERFAQLLRQRLQAADGVRHRRAERPQPRPQPSRPSHIQPCRLQTRLQHRCCVPNASWS